MDRGKLFHILKAYVKRPLPFLNGIVPGTSSLCSRTRENDLILSCRGSFAVHCGDYLRSGDHLQSGIIWNLSAILSLKSRHFQFVFYPFKTLIWECLLNISDHMFSFRIICRCHNKGSAFKSVIIRRWVLVQPRFEPSTGAALINSPMMFGNKNTIAKA